MPLVAAAVLAYAAGLLAGFGGAFVFTLIAAAVVVWRGAPTRRRRERVALAALVVAGFSTAASARVVESSCLDRLMRVGEWQVVLAADASPGAFVSGRHSCGVDLKVSVERGRAAAGSRVTVRGEATRARGSI